MTCDQLREFIFAHADVVGQTPDALLDASLAEHLGNCNACRAGSLEADRLERQADYDPGAIHLTDEEVVDLALALGGDLPGELRPRLRHAAGCPDCWDAVKHARALEAPEPTAAEPPAAEPPAAADKIWQHWMGERRAVVLAFVGASLVLRSAVRMRTRGSVRGAEAQRGPGEPVLVTETFGPYALDIVFRPAPPPQPPTNKLFKMSLTLSSSSDTAPVKGVVAMLLLAGEREQVLTFDSPDVLIPAVGSGQAPVRVGLYSAICFPTPSRP